MVQRSKNGTDRIEVYTKDHCCSMPQLFALSPASDTWLCCRGHSAQVLDVRSI